MVIEFASVLQLTKYKKYKARALHLLMNSLNFANSFWTLPEQLLHNTVYEEHTILTDPVEIENCYIMAVYKKIFFKVQSEFSV